MFNSNETNLAVGNFRVHILTTNCRKQKIRISTRVKKQPLKALLRKTEEKKMLSAKQTQLFNVFTRPFRGTERGATNEASVKENFHAKRQTLAKLVLFFSFPKNRERQKWNGKTQK